MCYSAKFDKGYENLVTQIRSQGLKKSFFFSVYGIYLTEYALGANLYVYASKRLHEYLDHETKFGFLIVSNKSTSKELKNEAAADKQAKRFKHLENTG